MGIYLTVFLYSVTTSIFFPVFQSLIFFKSCIALTNSTDPGFCYQNEAAAKDERVHTQSNTVLLVSSCGLCLTAFFTSRVVGRMSDTKSRKLAILVPFVGLLLSDITIIIQVMMPKIPPYFFILSECIFGMFGGYMSITSCAFAIVSSYHNERNDRSKAIARLEGTVSMGSMLGFLLSSQLDNINYLGMCSLIFCAHLAAFISALALENITPPVDEIKKFEICESTKLFNKKPENVKKSLRILYFSFAISYFAFIGSTRVLFFYLKHKFYWGSMKYGYLKAINQGMTTLMAFVLFPFLKSIGVSDVSLAIFGLATRSLGRFWYSVAWDSQSVFYVVVFEMFSKFPATALRSLISSSVANHERGVAFSLVAVIEAACNLSSSVVFHILFPKSLSFFPELSFVVMPIIIIPAIVLMASYHKTLDTCASSDSIDSSIEMECTSSEVQKLTTTEIA